MAMAVCWCGEVGYYSSYAASSTPTNQRAVRRIDVYAHAIWQNEDWCRNTYKVQIQWQYRVLAVRRFVFRTRTFSHFSRLLCCPHSMFFFYRSSNQSSSQAITNTLHSSSYKSEEKNINFASQYICILMTVWRTIKSISWTQILFICVFHWISNSQCVMGISIYNIQCGSLKRLSFSIMSNIPTLTIKFSHGDMNKSLIMI